MMSWLWIAGALVVALALVGVRESYRERKRRNAREMERWWVQWEKHQHTAKEER